MFKITLGLNLFQLSVPKKDGPVDGRPLVLQSVPQFTFIFSHYITKLKKDTQLASSLIDIGKILAVSHDDPDKHTLTGFTL